MEKKEMCQKHSTELSLYCKQCKILICNACIEEHSDQGHGMMLLCKYVAQIVLPEMETRLPTLKSKDEAKLLHDELGLSLTHARERESKRRVILQEAIEMLTADREGATQRLNQLKDNFHSAVAGNNNKELAHLLAEYSALNGLLSIPDAQNNQLRALVDMHKTIMKGWAAEDAFYAELQDYIKKLPVIKETVPFISTFRYDNLATLVLYNLKTQKAIKQHLDMPYVSLEHYISSAQVYNTLYLCGGDMKGTYLATTYKVTVDSNLRVKQQKVADMTNPKSNHTLVVHNDRLMLSLGGVNSSGILNCCECYTIATDTWEEWRPLCYARQSAYACSVHPQYVYCFGGVEANVETWLEKIDMQSPMSGWIVSAVNIQAPFVPNSHFGLCIQLDKDSILLFGNYGGPRASAIYRLSTNACEGYQQMSTADNVFVHSYPIQFFQSQSHSLLYTGYSAIDCKTR